MKKLSLLLIVLIYMAGCGNEGDVLIYRAIYDDISGVMLTENNNCALYDASLTAVAKYTVNPVPEEAEAVKRLLSENQKEIKAAPIFESKLTDRETDFMLKNNIDIADYTAGFSQQEAYKNRYIMDIDEFLYAFDHMSNEQLNEFLWIRTGLHQCACRITMIGYNHLFASVAENNLTYFSTEILPQLGSLTDGKPWSGSKTALEQEAAGLYDELRGLLGELEIFMNSLEIEWLKGMEAE